MEGLPFLHLPVCGPLRHGQYTTTCTEGPSDAPRRVRPVRRLGGRAVPPGPPSLGAEGQLWCGRAGVVRAGRCGAGWQVCRERTDVAWGAQVCRLLSGGPLEWPGGAQLAAAPAWGGHFATRGAGRRPPPSAASLEPPWQELPPP